MSRCKPTNVIRARSLNQSQLVVFTGDTVKQRSHIWYLTYFLRDHLLSSTGHMTSVKLRADSNKLLFTGHLARLKVTTSTTGPRLLLHTPSFPTPWLPAEEAADGAFTFPWCTAAENSLVVFLSLSLCSQSRTAIHVLRAATRRSNCKVRRDSKTQQMMKNKNQVFRSWAGCVVVENLPRSSPWGQHWGITPL